MAQVHLPFDSAVADRAGLADSAADTAADAPATARPAVDPADGSLDRVGFAIGWDHARHRLTPPVEHLHADNPVRQGWSAGRSVFGARPQRLTGAVRQWLALRLHAWQHGQAFEDVQVTPHFLAQLATPVCPVMREPLPPDAAIARLSPRAAYAAGNLALLGEAPRRALASHDGSLALALAARIDAGEAPQIDGLDAAQWTRLAVLQSFCTPLPHVQAALLPLRVLPPNRVRVQNPVQALQVMLTLQFTQAGYARRLLGLAALIPGGETRQLFQIFMHTLLARRLAVAQLPQGDDAAGACALRWAMEDSWRDVLVNRRWQRLALRLDAPACERVLQAAARRGLAGRSCQWLSAEQATDGWLADTGVEGPVLPRVPAPRAADVAAGRAAASPRQAAASSRSDALLAASPGGSRSPGNERKRDSQKLAS